MIVIGLQSGTSADGIDAAAADLTLDGDTILLRPLGARTTPLSDAVSDLLRSVLPPGRTDARSICVLDTLLGQAFADAATRADAELCDGRADLIVSHGQTVYHWVEDGTCHGTLQLGQPAWIAEATGRPVIADLRAPDVAAGGHGAPLAAVLDRLLLSGAPGRRAALNLGGMANVSIVADGVLECAFDTGPGNVLIDAAAELATGHSHDVGGQTAARGRVHQALLDALLADPYYDLAPPKSTGRERFNRSYLLDALAEVGLDAPRQEVVIDGPGEQGVVGDPAERGGLGDPGEGGGLGDPEERGVIGGPDLLATVTELTARTVAAAVVRAGAREVVVSGGGVRNPTLLGRLRDHLGVVEVTSIDRWGIPADSKEAYLFALLGFLSIHGLPGAELAATGAHHPAVLGTLVPPHAPLPVPTVPAVPPRRLRVVMR